MPPGGQSNGEGGEPRVLAAGPKPKLALRLIVLAGIFALAAAVCWVARRPAPPQSGLSQSRSVVPGAVPAEKSPQAELPPTLAPTVPNTQPPGPFTIESDNAKYEVLARVTGVAHGTASLRQMRVSFKGSIRCLVEGAPLPDGIDYRAWAKRLVTDAGETIISEFVPGPVQHSLNGKQPINTFSMEATVPESTEWLREVAATIPVYFVTKWETLTWENPAAARGQTRKCGAMELTLVDYAQTAKDAEFYVRGKWPPGDDALKQAVVELSLRCKERVLKAYGGGGGGGGYADWHPRCALGDATPIALEATCPAETKREEITFRLRNVALPVQPSPVATDAKAPAPAKASAVYRCEAGGLKFQLTSVELHSGDYPQLAVWASASSQPGSAIRYISLWSVEASAVPDIGGTLQGLPTPTAPHMRELPLFNSFMARLPAPHKDASRLVTFSGKLPVYMVEEQQTVEFALPAAGGEVGEPITKGPVALESLRFVDDVAAVKASIAISAMPGAREGGAFTPFTSEVLDIDGKPMKSKGSGNGSLRGRFSFHAEIALQGRKPATFRVQYVSKGHFEQIPFEFRDVELPRKAGKIEFPKLDF